ncbi:YqgE/AlgH family protein [Spirochaeta cellobiosiphila]|uniref:YqgE/AlgH family protein n=1 Tax=Spirochaeta cellobiosiphila TaxID=504483 RepID=UPI00041CA42B|nr:YqgE/AlgH family protein [Spirochaeta cellobiosiphila]
MGKGRGKSLSGFLLIAEPNLYDPNFYHGVILIVQHDEEGALGFVLNRQLDNKLIEVIKDIQDPHIAQQKVYWGGPLHEHLLFVLHNGIPKKYRSIESLEPVKDVIFEPDHHLIKSYLHDKTEEANPGFTLLPFAGCAVWAPEQLEKEIEEQLWTTLAFDKDIVFSDNKKDLWRAALIKKGGIYGVVAATGYKPSLN